MSAYYNPKRKGNLYSKDFPFRLSRSKIDLFINCPRCFYMDRKLGVSQPPGFPFSLNSAVDKLLKKEFDLLRDKGEQHPLMKKFGVDAIPLKNENLDEWRDPFKGITFKVEGTNLIITGGVDDIWINKKQEFIIVDYKATAKEEEVNLDAEWQIGYKRQMEIYQWLFKKNGFPVSDMGYFVYCNGKLGNEKFDGKLEFDIKIIPYIGNTAWVEKIILDAFNCLTSDKIPESAPECDFCRYRKSAKELEDK